MLMLDFLFQYGLFFAKLLTFIVGIIILCSVIASLIYKMKKEDASLSISNLNDRIREMRESLQQEILSKDEWKKQLKEKKAAKKIEKKIKKHDQTTSARVFVIKFNGDIRASEVSGLRETISAIIEVALPKDEVLLVLESSGGFVHSYGLAASQLQRLRQHNIYLTVSIDKVAASGGYLMAAVADRIIAAPFAIIGSIGVIAQLPNFHELLTKHHIEYEQHTAGEYKRTLTLFGKNTDKARRKFQEELEETHLLFKQYIAHYRPEVNLEQVATGEHWHGAQALNYHLIDDLQTSDDYILEKTKNSTVFEMIYEEKQNFTQKLSNSIVSAVEKGILKLTANFHPRTLI